MNKKITEKNTEFEYLIIKSIFLFECKQRQIVITNISDNKYTIYGDIVNVSYIILSKLITLAKLLSLNV